MKPGPRRAYFYWRCAAADVPAASAALAAWQAELQARHPGLACERHRRSEGIAGPATLMEVYGPLPQDPALLQQLQHEGERRTAAWRDGPRHMELFDEIS